ncbi:MAG: hypothetical protein A2046_06555 [Bacteroidetes bacterium GWA2_30_7]|nr:MAG: hypothetical protein A2046_06555 [Bacteroidetes bacterium GWA2_30_7]
MEKPLVYDNKPIAKDLKPGQYIWCACGKSDNQPYCDDSHLGSGIKPIKVDIIEEKKVLWCACKHSSNKPFCDGTHKSL